MNEHDGTGGSCGPEACGGDGQEGAVHDGFGAVSGGRADTPRYHKRYVLASIARFLSPPLPRAPLLPLREEFCWDIGFFISYRSL